MAAIYSDGSQHIPMAAIYPYSSDTHVDSVIPFGSDIPSLPLALFPPFGMDITLW